MKQLRGHSARKTRMKEILILSTAMLPSVATAQSSQATPPISPATVNSDTTPVTQVATSTTQPATQPAPASTANTAQKPEVVNITREMVLQVPYLAPRAERAIVSLKPAPGTQVESTGNVVITAPGLPNLEVKPVVLRGEAMGALAIEIPADRVERGSATFPIRIKRIDNAPITAGDIPRQGLAVLRDNKPETLQGNISWQELPVAATDTPERNGLIRNLQDGQNISGSTSTRLTVQAEAGANVDVYVNGELVDRKQVGERLEDRNKNILRLKYIGVQLRTGANTIEVRGTDAGGKTINDEIHVRVASVARDIRMETVKAVADGHSPIELKLTVLDEQGIRTELPSITVSGDNFSPLQPDADTSQSGFQVMIERGVGRLLLQPTSQASPFKLRFEVNGHSHEREINLQLAKREMLNAHVVTTVSRDGIEYSGRGSLEMPIGRGQLSAVYDLQGAHDPATQADRFANLGDASVVKAPLVADGPIAVQYNHPDLEARYARGAAQDPLTRQSASGDALRVTSRDLDRSADRTSNVQLEVTPTAAQETTEDVILNGSRNAILPAEIQGLRGNGEAQLTRIVTDSLGSVVETRVMQIGIDYIIDDAGIITFARAQAPVDSEGRKVRIEATGRSGGYSIPGVSLTATQTGKIKDLKPIKPTSASNTQSASSEMVEVARWELTEGVTWKDDPTREDQGNRLVFGVRGNYITTGEAKNHSDTQASGVVLGTVGHRSGALADFSVSNSTTVRPTTELRRSLNRDLSLRSHAEFGNAMLPGSSGDGINATATASIPVIDGEKDGKHGADISATFGAEVAGKATIATPGQWEWGARASVGVRADMALGIIDRNQTTQANPIPVGDESMTPQRANLGQPNGGLIPAPLKPNASNRGTLSVGAGISAGIGTMRSMGIDGLVAYERSPWGVQLNVHQSMTERQGNARFGVRRLLTPQSMRGLQELSLGTDITAQWSEEGVSWGGGVSLEGKRGPVSGRVFYETPTSVDGSSLNGGTLGTSATATLPIDIGQQARKEGKGLNAIIEGSVSNTFDTAPGRVSTQASLSGTLRYQSPVELGEFGVDVTGARYTANGSQEAWNETTFSVRSTYKRTLPSSSVGERGNVIDSGKTISYDGLSTWKVGQYTDANQKSGHRYGVTYAQRNNASVMAGYVRYRSGTLAPEGNEVRAELAYSTFTGPMQNRLWTGAKADPGDFQGLTVNAGYQGTLWLSALNKCSNTNYLIPEKKWDVGLGLAAQTAYQPSTRSSSASLAAEASIRPMRGMAITGGYEFWKANNQNGAWQTQNGKPYVRLEIYPMVGEGAAKAQQLALESQKENCQTSPRVINNGEAFEYVNEEDTTAQLTNTQVVETIISKP